MKIVVLTTDTAHHAYYVRDLQEALGPVAIFLETQEHPASDTRHPLEERRDEYESHRWFGGKRGFVSDYGPVSRFRSLNEDAAVAAIRQEAADVVVVYGTSRLKQPVIEAGPQTFLNLHGGDPESYRGLDSHLWAIYHRDFDGIMATMHRVDLELDAGEIVSQAKVPIGNGMPLHSLRAETAEICLQLTVGAVDAFRRSGEVQSRPQRHVGRYYSAMPNELKTICEKNFADYVEKLTPHEA